MGSGVPQEHAGEISEEKKLSLTRELVPGILGKKLSQTKSSKTKLGGTSLAASDVGGYVSWMIRSAGLLRIELLGMLGRGLWGNGKSLSGIGTVQCVWKKTESNDLEGYRGTRGLFRLLGYSDHERHRTAAVILHLP